MTVPMILSTDILHSTKFHGRGSSAVYRARVAANPDAYRAEVVRVVMEGAFTTEQGQRLHDIIDAIVAGGEP
jgi:hypothetical protein